VAGSCNAKVDLPERLARAIAVILFEKICNLFSGKMRHWLHEKGVAGFDFSQSKFSPKRRCRSTPTAKRTPNIQHLALGLAVSMDHATEPAKPEPINARYATRSRVATSIRSFSTSAATMALPLFRLTFLQV
jgi:hypothetical protein